MRRSIGPRRPSRDRQGADGDGVWGRSPHQEHGVAVRMAVLFLLSGSGSELGQ
jgi:hypothetical protein